MLRLITFDNSQTPEIDTKNVCSPTLLLFFSCLPFPSSILLRLHHNHAFTDEAASGGLWVVQIHHAGGSQDECLGFKEMYVLSSSSPLPFPALLFTATITRQWWDCMVSIFVLRFITIRGPQKWYLERCSPSSSVSSHFSFSPLPFSCFSFFASTTQALVRLQGKVNICIEIHHSTIQKGCSLLPSSPHQSLLRLHPTTHSLRLQVKGLMVVSIV